MSDIVSKEKDLFLSVNNERDHDMICEIARALSVPDRVRILKSLLLRSKNLSEISQELDIPVSSVARHIDALAEEIFSDEYATVTVEYSREGNPRELLNPKDRLYLELVKQAQAALKALGMNTDAKERKSASDGFSDFLQEFNNA